MTNIEALIATSPLVKDGACAGCLALGLQIGLVEARDAIASLATVDEFQVSRGACAVCQRELEVIRITRADQPAPEGPETPSAADTSPAASSQPPPSGVGKRRPAARDATRPRPTRRR